MNVNELVDKRYKLTQLWEGCRKDIHSFIAIISHDMVEYKEEADCFVLKIEDNLFLDIKSIVKTNINDMIDFDVYTDRERTKFIFKPKNDFTKDLLLMIKKYNKDGSKK